MSNNNGHDYITFGWTATIIGLLLFGALLDSHKPDKYQSSYYARKCAERYGDSPFSAARIHSKSGDPITEKTDDKSEANTDWCDLAAQQSVAEDTTNMYRISLFGLITTAIGIFLIWQTLEANRKSTDAAWAAVNHAEKTSRLELRAYLAVAPKGVNQLIGTQDVMGHIEVRNVGRLPARKVVIHVRMGLFNGRIRDLAGLPIVNDLTDRELGFVDRVVQPGDSRSQGSQDRQPLVFITPDEWEFVLGSGLLL
nr:hypothetical protein P9270_017105 [Mesorhizobium sp. WSM4875]